jgi:hypothetical protein
MTQQIIDALRQAWTTFLGDVAAFVPRVAAALSIVVAGWLIAAAARAAVRRVLGWVHVNRLAERSELAEMLRTAQLPSAEILASRVVFWLVWIGFLLAGVDALQFRSLEGIVVGFVQFVPRLFVAAAIVLVGVLVANFAWRATLLAAVNARLPSARLLAAGLRFVIVTTSVAIALEQIRVATAVVLTAFAIAFGAVMLGLAIAFGLGGRDVAKRLLEQQFTTRGPRDGDDMTHL